MEERGNILSETLQAVHTMVLAHLGILPAVHEKADRAPSQNETSKSLSSLS